MTNFHYRLQTLLDGKDARKQECERALMARRGELQDAVRKLEELKAQQAGIESSKAAARAAVHDGNKDAFEMDRCVNDVQIFNRRLQDNKDAVLSQRIEIEEREEQVRTAEKALADATRELEILKKHRQKAERRFFAEQERKETIEQEEIASAMYEARRR